MPFFGPLCVRRHSRIRKLLLCWSQPHLICTLHFFSAKPLLLASVAGSRMAGGLLAQLLAHPAAAAAGNGAQPEFTHEGLLSDSCLSNLAEGALSQRTLSAELALTALGAVPKEWLAQQGEQVGRLAGCMPVAAAQHCGIAQQHPRRMGPGSCWVAVCVEGPSPRLAAEMKFLNMCMIIAFSTPCQLIISCAIHVQQLRHSSV